MPAYTEVLLEIVCITRTDVLRWNVAQPLACLRKTMSPETNEYGETPEANARSSNLHSAITCQSAIGAKKCIIPSCAKNARKTD